MSEDLDSHDRQIARRLDQFAEGVFPAGESVETVIVRATTPRRSASLVRNGLGVAAMALVALIALAWPGGLRAPVGGAGSPTASASTQLLTDCRPDRFLELMGRVLIDYEAVDSPRELASLADLVIVGRIAKVERSEAERGEGSRLAVDVAQVVIGDSAVTKSRVSLAVPIDVSPVVGQEVAACRLFLFLVHREQPANDSLPVFGALPQGFWLESPSGLRSVYAPGAQAPPAWVGIDSLDALTDAVTSP